MVLEVGRALSFHCIVLLSCILHTFIIVAGVSDNWRNVDTVGKELRCIICTFSWLGI